MLEHTDLTFGFQDLQGDRTIKQAAVYKIGYVLANDLLCLNPI